MKGIKELQRDCSHIPLPPLLAPEKLATMKWRVSIFFVFLLRFAEPKTLHRNEFGIGKMLYNSGAIFL